LKCLIMEECDIKIRLIKQRLQLCNVFKRWKLPVYSVLISCNTHMSTFSTYL
jgi:hypothetical protein